MTELAAALQEESTTIHWQTVTRLNTAEAHWDDSMPVSKLTEALANEHAFVRWQAGLALVGQAKGRQTLLDFLKNYPASPSESTLPSTKIDLMCAAAIDVLVEIKSSEARSYLITPLLAGDATLRQSAAEALARQRHPEALPHLINALRDNNPWVRRAAALALGHMGDGSAVKALIKCLQDKAVIVRRSTAYALGALRSAAALPALQISLTDQDAQVRRNAAWALGRIGRPEAVTALSTLLEDPQLNGAVAAVAREAITRLTRPRWQQMIWGWGNKRPAG